jgi:hypothetical protein
MGRHVARVSTPELNFGSAEITSPKPKDIGQSWICAVEGFRTQPEVGCKCNMV